MNPRAPHHRFRPSSSSDNSGKDLESIYGSLCSSFVPASTSTMNGAREPSSPAVSIGTGEPSTHSRSLVKFQPQNSSDDELLERARSEQLEQNQLAMHTKILRLSDQVLELTAQSSAFEEEKAKSDKIIDELRREIAALKTKSQEHHNKLDVCKRGIDDNAKEVQSMGQRIKAIPGNLDSRFQYHTTRLDKFESLVRGAGIQIKQHATQLREGEERIAQLEHKIGSVNLTITHNDGPHSQQDAFVGTRHTHLKLNIEEILHTQDSHQSYLEQTGQTLITHQNNMDTVSKTVDDLRSKLERLSTSNSGLSSNDSSISKLQHQIDRLAEEVRCKGNNAEEDAESKALSINDTGVLDELRNEINSLADMHRLMDQISLSNKIGLETMFYQLTKELAGRCLSGEIEFGLDEDRLFILRQRVLERLSVEDSVQCEFLRLKQSQQMFT
ncbi:hypothetical protein QM012_008013 [Aureobasidium pullulans]|uniref:Uncharacterized protein n=1 Tax=Aureobasidium pullulans TaxID=5580 RepID=A0ABR0TLF8_AURPU